MKKVWVIFRKRWIEPGYSSQNVILGIFDNKEKAIEILLKLNNDIKNDEDENLFDRDEWVDVWAVEKELNTVNL